MTKSRLEAFSDGVIAIIITIMVLELRVPDGGDWAAVRELLPELSTYVLSFVFVGIYWNNHHHMLHAAERITGRVLWPNLHLLFWLSLIPLGAKWVGHDPSARIPAAIYGVILLMCAIAWLILQWVMVAEQPPNSRLGRAVGSDFKGWISFSLYVVAIPLAFLNPWYAYAVYVIVALIWIVPDKRIEAHLQGV